MSPTFHEWGQIEDVWRGRLAQQERWGSPAEVTAISVALGFIRRGLVDDLFRDAFGRDEGHRLVVEVHTELNRLWDEARRAMPAGPPDAH